MISISIERLETLSSELSFESAMIERAARLLDVLDQISNDGPLKGMFALKGGTALNLFHLALDRLSVDIDLNYVGAEDRKTMDEHRKIIDARLPRLVSSAGYELRRDPGSEHAGGKWIFRYTSAFRRPGTLEVDVNYMYRTPFFGISDMASALIGPYLAKNVTVVDLHEIAAGKIVALASRSASRDLYDAWRLLQMDEVDWKKVKAATMAIGAATARDFDWRDASLKNYSFDGDEIRGKLVHVVKTGMLGADPEQWCRDALEECRSKLSFLFEYDANEMAFFDALYNEGKIDTSTIDADPAVKTAIGKFPGLLWKAQNIRQHKERQSSQPIP